MCSGVQHLGHCVAPPASGFLASCPSSAMAKRLLLYLALVHLNTFTEHSGLPEL